MALSTVENVRASENLDLHSSGMTRDFGNFHFWVPNLRHLKGAQFSEGMRSAVSENESLSRCLRLGTQKSLLTFEIVAVSFQVTLSELG